MSLRDYNRKRDFKKTAEPRGETGKTDRHRFVIQKHDASHLHYDFRLELDGVLKSWAVPKGPSLDPTQKRLAMEVEDHPVSYGSFEGTIPQGEYGGGTVMLWDEGVWKPQTGDALKQLKSGSLKFRLEGHKLHGNWALVRMRKAGDRTWLLIKEKDDFAKPLSKGDILKEEALSVKTGRDLPDIAAGKAASKRKPKAKVAKTPARVYRSASAGKVPALHLTHPDKVLFPELGYTKADLAEYYAAVSDRMLEHIAGRPLMLVRCPTGAEKVCFHQRNWTEGLPKQVKKVKVRGEEPLITVDSPEGLLALAQFGTLEIHAWNTHFSHIEHPDQFVFDLDPDESVAWDKITATALLIRKHLLAVGLKSFVKTTGGKGLHIVAPVEPKLSWDLGLQFTKALSDDIATANPKLYLTKMTKSARKGRIFLDYLRNGRSALAVAPYSPRARAGATVSFPVAWKDVENGIRSDAFDIKSAPAELGADPWKGFTALRQLPRLK